MAGLLGMGGLGALGGMTPPAGLLGPSYDPRQMKNAMLKRGLLQTGIGLMRTGNLGEAFAGGLEGADAARTGYMQDAFTMAQLEEKNRAQQAAAEQERKVQAWLDTLSPEEQSMAEAFPDQYATQFLQSKFATTQPKAPSMETLYDEKTGQPYKAQWDNETQSWKRVGGNKADDQGIEITNPDGTVTRIGGSGTKSTEADRRAKLLAQQITAQEPQLMQQFDTLATVQNTIGSETGTVGRAFMSGEGQMAEDALKNVVQNWLYLTSGATAPDAEVERQFKMVKPTALDKPEALAGKKARLQMIIDSMKMRAGIQATPPAAPAAQDGGWTVLPNGVKIRKKQ